MKFKEKQNFKMIFQITKECYYKWLNQLMKNLKLAYFPLKKRKIADSKQNNHQVGLIIQLNRLLKKQIIKLYYNKFQNLKANWKKIMKISKIQIIRNFKNA